MSTGNRWARLQEIVSEVSRSGTVGVAVVGPDGSTWQHQGDRKFSAASTVKIPIMIETYRRIDAGQRSLDDRYTVTEEDRTAGSGVLNHMRPGLNLTFYDLLYLMISISDNVATNILIKQAGIEPIKRTMVNLGMRNSNLDRMMLGGREANEPENLATPNDYARAIMSILDNEAASIDSCKAMTELLAKQQNRNRIARYLPSSARIQWGSKTGTIPGVANDVGYITGSNGRLIIAVYTENFVDTHTAERAIGEISRAAMADSGVAGPLYTS